MRSGIREDHPEPGTVGALTPLERELLTALIWMVENDETNEGDTPMPEHGGRSWDEINAYWIAGLDRARSAISKAQALEISGRNRADATPNPHPTGDKEGRS